MRFEMSAGIVVVACLRKPMTQVNAVTKPGST
jgi:hypothetical protein